MRQLTLFIFILTALCSSNLFANDQSKVDHTTIMSANCVLQNKKDINPGCKKNSDAFMSDWNQKSQPFLKELKSVLINSKLAKLEVSFSVDHTGEVKNIKISRGFSEKVRNKIKFQLAKLRFNLVEGNEFKLNICYEKRPS
mgnify:CR=1 FL=1